MGFDVFSLDAANAAQSANNKANTNLNASIALLQMVSEMRDFTQQRFNDVITGLNNRKHENDALMAEINDLKAQVAGLQRKLYEEEQKNKGIAR